MKSASPTVRALDELKRFHENEVSHLGDEEYNKANSELDLLKKASEKATVDAVVNAIKGLHIPYNLDHATVCNIRNWDGRLKFELSFDSSKSKDAASANKKISEIIQRWRNATADLEKWYIKSLYDIAGRSNVTEFKVNR